MSVRETVPNLDNNWHYHDEFELIYTIKGEGVRVVGDNLSNFKEPELVLVGAGLPHLWKNEFTEEEEFTVDVVITKFQKTFSGMEIFEIPELQEIKSLLEKSNRGLLFGRNSIKKVHKQLLQLPELEGVERLLTLLSILKTLAKGKDYVALTSEGFTGSCVDSEEHRLNRTINYISNNFTNQLTLDDIAQEAMMTPNSLCRFFKNSTNKTIFQFVNEFRIGKACQMLINGDASISEICFTVGFNSLTSFNRVFKSCKGLTPREYKRHYQVLNE